MDGSVSLARGFGRTRAGGSSGDSAGLGKQEGPADHSLPCCGPGLVSDPPPCPGPGTSGLGDGSELISHRMKSALPPSTCQNFSEKGGVREGQAIAQGDLNKNGHGTCL